MDPNKVTVLLGPPGCSKTTSLLSIVEKALGEGVPPDRVGFFSFTKNAAEEGKSRAVAKFNMSPEELPYFRTLHSMSYRQLGINRQQMFGRQHVRELGKRLGMDFKGHGEAGEDDVYGMAPGDRILFLEGLARNTKRPLRQVWSDAFEDSIDWFELERFSSALQQYKKSRMLVDFTDLLEKFCQVQQNTLPKFDVMVVDEAQDLSALQWDAIELLGANARQVYVGGDDLQGIYMFSGASVETFINLRGRTMLLDQSYRVPSSVQSLALRLESLVSNKRPRTWKPRAEVGAVNWYNSLEEVDLSKGQWLLLARNGYMLNNLEDWCMSQGFSFHSVNRNPLKSSALAAIRTWESLRRGQEEPAEKILDVLKFMGPNALQPGLPKKLRSDPPGKQYAMPELVTLGLGSQAIWHEALTKISAKERDFFIAARRRGEPLLKEPRIRISTIHASKGGEAEHVLLITDLSYRCHQNMEKNFDDEVRVWYVAATRCSKTLNLVMPQTNLYFEL